MSDLTPEMPPIPSAASTPPPPPAPPPVNPYAAPYADVSPPTLSAEGVSSDIRTKAMLCHLLAFAGLLIPLGNFLGPLVMWLTQKEKSPFIDHHGKESLNFQITLAIGFLVCLVLTLILIGILMMFALGIYAIVMIVIASIKTNEGQYYRYPYTIRFIK